MQERDRWVDIAIAALTLTAVCVQMFGHDPRVQAKAIKLRQHLEYQARRFLRAYRQYHEPAWRTELREHVTDA